MPELHTAYKLTKYRSAKSQTGRSAPINGKIDYLRRFADKNHILYGSDYPFASIDKIEKNMIISIGTNNFLTVPLLLLIGHTMEKRTHI